MSVPATPSLRRSQVIRASFVISVTPHETFGSLLAKLRKHISLRGPEENGEHASITSLQNANRDDLDLTSLIGKVYRPDAVREERVVFAVQEAMEDAKGKKRRRQEGRGEDGREGKRSRVTGGLDLAMTNVGTETGAVKRSPSERDMSKTPKSRKQSQDPRAGRPGREEVLVPDSQVSLPTPRSVLPAYEAPTSAQKPVASQAPASGRFQEGSNRLPSRKALSKRADEELDALEDEELEEEEVDYEVPGSEASVPRRSPDVLIQVTRQSAKSKARIKTPRKEGRFGMEGMEVSRTANVLNDVWTPAEDALLLRALRERLSVRDMLKKYKMPRTVTAARSRRLILARKYPDGTLPAISGTLSEIMAVHDAPSNDQRRVIPVQLSSNDDAKLETAIAAGYDPSEIVALCFPHHLQDEIEERFAQLLPSVLQSERKKEDWPQDDIHIVGWEGEQDLKLRRCLREKLNTEDAYKRYFFDWKVKPVRRKIVAYKHQMLGDDYDQTEFDDTSIIVAGTHELVTPGSKSQVQPRRARNAAIAQGSPNDEANVVQPWLSSTTRAHASKSLDVAPGARSAATKTDRTRSRNKKSRTKQLTRDKAGKKSKNDGACMIPEVSTDITERQKAQGARENAMSINRHKVLEILRKKQSGTALESDEESLNEELDVTSLFSTDHTEVENDGNDEGTHLGIPVDTYDAEEDGLATPEDEIEAVAPSMVQGNTNETMASHDPDYRCPSTVAMASRGIILGVDHRNTSKAKKGAISKSGKATAMSDNESADTAVWQNQASAQLLGSPSSSPRPLDTAKSTVIAPDSQYNLHRSPSRIRSAEVNQKLCTNVRTQFSLRPDSRPSSQLVRELELSSAQSRANLSQEHARIEDSVLQSRGTAPRQSMPLPESQIDEYAIDFASPESSTDTSVPSPDAVQLENQHMVEKSPEFMMQSSARSRSQRLKTYESKSPRTPITNRARAMQRDLKDAGPVAERAKSPIPTDCAPNDAPSATPGTRRSGSDASVPTQGKLPRRPNQNNHVSDALRRRSIAMGVRSAVKTAQSQHFSPGQQRRSTSLEAQQEFEPSPHAARDDLRSALGSSQPVTSFYDIENRAVQRESSNGLPTDNESRDREQHSTLPSIASSQSSPLINGTLKDAMDLAVDPASHHSSTSLATENITKTNTEKFAQPTYEASEESAEEEISRCSQNSSDEQDFSDDVDSDIAGVDYASSTSEGNENFIRDREVQEINSESDEFDDAQVEDKVEPEDTNQAGNNSTAKAIPEETIQPWSELPGDNPLMYPRNDQEEKSDTEALIDHVLQCLPAQNGELGRGEINSNLISQGVVTGSAEQTSASSENVSVNMASNAGSDATSINVPSTSSSGDTDDEVSGDTSNRDRRTRSQELQLRESSARDIQQQSENKNGDVMGPQTLSAKIMLSDGKPRQARSSTKSPIDSYSSGSRSSLESDSDESSSDSEIDGSESEGGTEDTGQQRQRTRDRTRDREHSPDQFIAGFNTNPPIARALPNDTRSTFDETAVRLSRDGGNRLSESKLSSRPQLAQDDAGLLHTVSTPAIASRISPLVRVPGTASPASTAPVAPSSLKDTETAFRVKHPIPSPSMSTMKELSQQRFHLSALLGKATSIPASSQKLDRGQPVKRSLPNISDDDDDDDDDGSDGTSSST